MKTTSAPVKTPTRVNAPAPQGEGQQGELKCADCGSEIKDAVKVFSTRKFGRPLCRDCQDKQKQGA
jgi:hypothetical protein